MADPSSAPEPLERIHFGWLVRLRWVAILGQALVIGVSSELLGVGLPLAALGAVLAVEVALNLVLAGWLRRTAAVNATHVALAIAADLLLFTVVLYLSGGPSNPFSFLYLVHLALAALMLPPRLGWGLVALSLACSAALFLEHVPLVASDRASHAGHADSAHAHHASHDHSAHAGHAGRAHAGGDGFDWHLRGMWVALGVSASFIVYFLRRVALELAERERLLAAARDLIARAERLSALGTLAAGAAHELGTPLGTIAVAARELERSLETRAEAGPLEDARLIRAQVDRCRAILDELAANAGQPAGAAADSVALDEFVRATLARLPDASRVEASLPEPPPKLRVPAAALGRALGNLLKNALLATAEGKVRLSANRDGDELVLAVADDGPGMTQAVLDRAAEPFFSTRAPGTGMGLGLFLARSVVEQLGGRLEIRSESGRGTRAALILPAGVISDWGASEAEHAA